MEPIYSKKQIDRIIGVTVTTEEAYDDTNGFCLNCGEEAYGIEPDAHEYTCSLCNKNTVYGIQELGIMGRLRIEDEFED